MIEIPERPWSCDSRAIQGLLDVACERGLSADEAGRRLEEFGPNRLKEFARRSTWRILVDQLRSLIVALLGVAAIISFVVGQGIEAGAIVIVILINTAIGFFTELKALRSMEALRRLGGSKAVVRRDGKVGEIDADHLVPGDIVILDAGDAMTADLRVLQSSKLQANESALTGESIPVGKNAEVTGGETLLADRTNMLFKGTFLTRGSGEAVVVGTGMRSELGEISALVEKAAQEEDSPLERRLDRLGKKLIGVTLVITALVAVLGIIQGKDFVLMIETGVALAVAAIPEGLPIVATIALARGMMRLARRNVLIRKLAAVETLGATTVICTDKTGTLTENQMTVTHLAVAGGTVDLNSDRLRDVGEEELLRLLEIGVLCNNASLSEQVDPAVPSGTGDPVELALLGAGKRFGIDRAEMAERFPEIREVAFDPDIKMMATVHSAGGVKRFAVKGAPEAVLAICDRGVGESGTEVIDDGCRRGWLERNEALAGMGLRVLGLAEKEGGDAEDDPYAGLVFVGLVAMEDPPRGDVRSAIEACRRAGIRVVMVTGDQPVTARHIAVEIGLVEAGEGDVMSGAEIDADPGAEERIASASVLARVSPKQKLNLIDLHRRRGEIVAMTGDGVNDAPALERADIGVAMGLRGTQVARESSDMVLGDDALSSIVAAVGLGRVIFGNIRKFVIYLLSCNTSEVMVVGLASLVNAPLPILPLQILFLNLVTDVFPALALGVGRGDAGVMGRPPRDPGEAFLPGYWWWGIAGYAFAISSAVLGAMAAAIYVFGMDSGEVVTVCFLTLGFAQIWHVYNMRDRGSRIFRNDITGNRVLWGAVVVCVVLLLCAVHVPALSRVLGTEAIGWRGWVLTLGMSAVPLVWGGIFRLWSRRPSIGGRPRLVV